MTPKERAAMQQALEALESYSKSDYIKKQHPKRRANGEKAITALQEALAEQAEQEPVAWFVQYKNRHEFVFGSKPEFIVDGVVEPLYAAPVRTKDPCHPWQDLTDDEIMKINVDTAGIVPTCDRQFHFARAVIAADRGKNCE